MELDALELAILKTLLFTESFDRIVEENGYIADRNIVADGLKSLLKYKLVRPMNETDQGYSVSLVYDSDRMGAFHYQATAKGIEYMESQS